jgi:hypothetical protein
MDVLVFSTSVESSEQVRSLAPLIDSLAGRGRWNFALDDCDKILRIVSNKVKPRAAIHLLTQYGYRCQELPD